MLNKRVNYTSFKTIVTKMTCVVSILPESLIARLPEGPLLHLCDFICFKPQNKTELQDAVDMWCKDRETAEKKYGHISEWDTSMITDMSGLFKHMDKFNDNISTSDGGVSIFYTQN